ncbi:MAG: hypothetical protein EXR27_15255 [Betaproteobacteria bacterium]|nr:hypothetical protein [Betaproteobacteria bacterium]
MMDALKAVKSAEDIAFLRRSAAMQDDVMAKMAAHIAPGRHDYEASAWAQYLGQLGGSEGGCIATGRATRWWSALWCATTNP